MAQLSRGLSIRCQDYGDCSCSNSCSAPGFCPVTGTIPPPPPPPPQPATFSLSAIQISGDKVNPGEMVTIQTTVSNTGGSLGSFSVILKVNGTQAESKDVSLDAGKTQTVTFQLQKDIPGDYSLEVNGNSVQITVLPPPSGGIANLSNTLESTVTSVSSDNGATPILSTNIQPPVLDISTTMPEKKASFPLIPMVIGVVALLLTFYPFAGII